jgi:hypothetical protein
MPAFFAEALDALMSMPHLAMMYWEGLTLTSRIIFALAAVGLGIYGGSRAERTGLSTLMFFGAFGFFAYIIAVGIELIR